MKKEKIHLQEHVQRKPMKLLSGCFEHFVFVCLTLILTDLCQGKHVNTGQFCMSLSTFLKNQFT